MASSSTLPGLGTSHDDRAAIVVAVAGSLLLHIAITMLPARAPSLSGHASDAPATTVISALLVTASPADALRVPVPDPGAAAQANALASAAPVHMPTTAPAVPGLPRPGANPASLAMPALPIDRRVVSAPPIVRGAVRSSVVTREVPDYHGLVASNADAIAPYRHANAEVPPQVPAGFMPAFPVAEFEGGFERQLGAVVLVRADGFVDDVLMDRDMEAFREAVDSAVRGTQFIPATRAGVPVAGWLALRFDFLILGSAPEIKKMVSEARH